MNRVLIITYYWPPSGGSAVLRWLKFTKYLGEFGWEPVIYTPSNPEPQENDESLLADIPENLEILRTKILEPYGIYKILTGKKLKDKLGVALMSDKRKPGMISKISLWIRSNLFIPDPRMLWINPSVKFLNSYLKQHPVDVIVSTGPPHSMHLIAHKLKRKTDIKWIADFRDPWTNIDFYRELLLTPLADWYHRRLERKVLINADHVITVSPGLTEEFKSFGIQHVATITNGFDTEPGPTEYHTDPKYFTILHLGSMPKSRNPEVLWKAISELLKEDPRFTDSLKIRLIGKIDLAVSESLRRFHLDDYLIQESYIPHNRTFEILAQSSVLLLCINNTPNSAGILTNKFFEYLSAQRPILGIGPVAGDASVILNETRAGKMFEYDDLAGLKEQVSSLFNLYSQKNLKVDSRNIEKFSRKKLTGQLVTLMKALIIP